MMNVGGVRRYCDGMKGAVAEYPFGPEARVYKIGGKMFALIGASSISLKCDPVFAEIVRERYAAVTAGDNLNKRHWNTVELDGTVPDAELREMIDASYELVVASLTRAQRAALG